MENRSTFSNRLGFVLAAAGSAVGLGNLWRFPYLAANNGGGIFLLVYIILVVTFGFTLMIAEIALGRKMRLSVIGAYRALNKRWSFVGVLATLVPVLILPYYVVIGGWVTKYLVVYLTGNGMAAAESTFFAAHISQTAPPLIYALIFLLMTLGVILLGVQGGVERVSRVMMPALILLAVGLVLYCLTLEGAGAGFAYYLLPDFSRFSFNLLLAAMGQMFFSLSLAMGIMVTYGSYMKKEDDIEKAVGTIEMFDTGVAILAGLLIVPMVYVFSGGDVSSMGQGPGLMFVTMPQVFAGMEGVGNLLGLAFFLLVLFAALTSAISLMEAIVSIAMDRFQLSRNKSAFLVFAFTSILAIPSSLGYGIWDTVRIGGKDILDLFDFVSNSVLMPVVALLTCIFIGFVIKPEAISAEVKLSSAFHREKLFVVFIKYIAPVLVIFILVSSLMG